MADFNYLYDTVQLIDALEKMPPFHTYLHDTFFPDGPVFNTKKILIDYREGDQMAAPFVAPRVGGIVIADEGFTTEEIAPCKMGVRKVLTVDQLDQRGFGEALNSNLTPAQRQAKYITEDMAEMQKMLARAREAMCAQIMFTGECLMQEMGPDAKVVSEKIVKYDIDNSATILYDWDTSEDGGKQIISDLDAMILRRRQNGLPTDTLLCSYEVANVIQYNDYLMKLRDNRTFTAFDQSNTTISDDGHTTVCKLNVNGIWLDVVTYPDTYKDPYTKTIKTYVPTGKICLAYKGAGETRYAAITQIEQGAQEFVTYANKEVPKFRADDLGESRDIQLSSKPLPYPKQKKAFSVATVITGSNPRPENTIDTIEIDQVNVTGAISSLTATELKAGETTVNGNINYTGELNQT